jgi:hypothetical protein
VVRRGSESEHSRHTSGEAVLGRCGVDLKGGQSQTRRFLAEGVREHPVAFEQVAQGSFRIGGPGEKPRGRSAPTLDHRPAEVWRREEPDGLSMYGEEGLDEA